MIVESLESEEISMKTAGPGKLTSIVAVTAVALSLLLLVCASGWTSQGSNPGGGALPWLTVSDGKLVTATDGRPVSLRGVNLASYLWFCSFDTYISDLKERGILGPPPLCIFIF